MLVAQPRDHCSGCDAAPLHEVGSDSHRAVLRPRGDVVRAPWGGNKRRRLYGSLEKRQTQTACQRSLERRHADFAIALYGMRIAAGEERPFEEDRKVKP